MTRKTFADGDRWMAADAQLVMDQGIPLFADAAQRDAQWPAPPVGSRCYLADTTLTYVRLSTGWTPTSAYGLVTKAGSQPLTGSGWARVTNMTTVGKAFRGATLNKYGGGEVTVDGQGLYAVHYGVRFAGTPAGVRVMIGLQQSGAGVAPGETVAPSNTWTQSEATNGSAAAANVYVNGSAMLALAAGQSFALAAYVQQAQTGLSVDNAVLAFGMAGV